MSIFDFTNLYKSKNACQVLDHQGEQLLLAVVGDSLMEPFWPEGTGIGRGFLSVLDTAWLVRRWVEADRGHLPSVLEVIREREKLYCLLRQTNPEHLKNQFRSWTIQPSTRYSTRQFTFNSGHVSRLYRVIEDNDEVDMVDGEVQDGDDSLDDF